MKLLSIDVGMKCLAYCLFSVDEQNYSIEKWGILDLCNQKKYKCCGINKKNKQPCEKQQSILKTTNITAKFMPKSNHLKYPPMNLKKHVL